MPRLAMLLARLIAGVLPPGDTRLNSPRNDEKLVVVIAVISDEMLDATDAATSLCTAWDGNPPELLLPVEPPLLHAASAATQAAAANPRAKP
jgi:hypothetical protein